MNIEYTPFSRRVLRDIHSYIAQDSLEVANSVIDRITQSIVMLETFPLLGRNGRKLNTRELIIPRLPYFAVYRIPDEYRVQIIRIFHTSRMYL